MTSRAFLLPCLALAVRLFAAAIAPPPAAIAHDDKALQAELLAILKSDQEPRAAYEAAGKKFGWNSPEMQPLAAAMMAADAANLPRITTILDQRGWVGPEVVGEDASSTQFYVIQHSNPATQKKYLPLLRDAVQRGKAQGAWLAMMEDRVAAADGRKQVYGTQLFNTTLDPAWRLRPIEEPEHVDERRAALGLPPMAEYLKHWNLAWDAKAFAAAQAAAEAAK